MSDARPPAVPPEVRARIEQDPWAQSLGIEYLEVRKGYARLGLTLQPHMVNHQGYPHGAVIFALADTAFGAACNSHGPPAVALNVTISFLAAPKPGARLLAEGRERRQGRRAGFYDITVSAEDGTTVAFAHCIAHRVASG
jgi:acyl-CoA thioesterase